MKRKEKLLLIAFVLLILMVGSVAFCYESFDGNFEVGVEVYVLALDGVGCSEVEDIDRMVGGALQACNLSYTNGSVLYRWFAVSWPLEFREVKLNKTVSLVSSWSLYKQIVESEENAIIINAHGEVLPVPHGYSEEEWINKIAEAMLERRITWAHTAGYPFNYTWQEDANNMTVLGVNGFRTLMSHIGLNVTGVDCLPPGSLRTRIDLHVTARYHLKATWGFDDAFYVDRGYPLNGSVFKNYTIQPIWGVPDTYSTGAAIAYKHVDQADYGFYVHIGTLQTYNMKEEPTDKDFMRGYVAAAASIYTVAFSEAGEQAVGQAEEAILKAEEEGRSQGLQRAKDLLEQAKSSLKRYNDLPWVAELTYYSINEAENAQKPSPNPLAQAILLIGIAAIGTGAIAITVKLKNRKGETKNEKN